MEECQQNNAKGFAEFVAQTMLASEAKSMTYYAANSLLECLPKYGITSVDADVLRLWGVSLLMSGMKANTVKRYAAKLHSLYEEWGGADADDPFDAVQSVFDSACDVDDSEVLANAEGIKILLSRNEASTDWAQVGMFFYMLYNADATLHDAAYMTFDDAPRYCAQVADVVKACNSAFGRKYLFSLNQSKARSTQVVKTLAQELAEEMAAVGMKIAPGQERQEITAMWIAAALKCGVDLRDVRAIVPAVPYRYRALALLPKTEIPDESKRRIICTVADAINANTAHWFVMKLRKGVGVDALKEKIDAELPGRLATMELYYPTRTKVKKVGKKVVKEQIPYVPDLLFFRTQYSKVRGLFAKIGDMAWCLKVSKQSESRYSVISHAEMSNFQQCVGQFTDDIKVVYAEATQALAKGREVRITGGMMKGYQGVIEDLDDANGTRKFYLRVSSDSALNWTAEVEEYFIEPINN